MILSGPFGPRCTAETWVASEKVGEGGSGDGMRLEPKVNVRRERGRLGAMMDVRYGLRSAQMHFRFWASLILSPITCRYYVTAAKEYTFFVALSHKVMGRGGTMAIIHRSITCYF
jgi:hypothetical protein